MSASNGDNEKRDSLIFELIKRRFDSEGERTNNLDGKAGNLVGFVSVLVGLLLGAGSLLSGGEILKSSILLSSHVLTLPYFVGVASLLTSIGCALIALKIH
jgi:hypothetical protein